MSQVRKTAHQLVKSHTADRTKLINRLQKGPRGDVLMYLLGLLDEAKQDITQHPFLQTAHRRAKRAEERLCEQIQKKNAARRAQRAAERRANVLEGQLATAENQANIALEQLLVFQEGWDATQEVSNSIADDTEQELAEAYGEIDRLTSAFTALNKLRLSELDTAVATTELERLGCTFCNRHEETT